MSYQEKRTIVALFSGLIVLIAYCFYTFTRYSEGYLAQDDLKMWATIMLVFVGIGIVVSIVIQIIFHILLSMAVAIKETIKNGQNCDGKEIDKSIKLEMVEDEMDKIIGLKSMRIAFVVAGIGFIAALTSSILNYSPAVMLNIIFISFSAGNIMEGFSQLYYYKRGIANV